MVRPLRPTSPLGRAALSKTPSRPALPRLLPTRDNLLLAHRHRERVLPADLRPHVILTGGHVQPTFLIDGFVAGIWDWEASGRRGCLRLRPFAPVPAGAREELVDEARALARFLAAEEAAVEVTFAAPDS
ncbi:MAG: winged helix DNA-binding domain-containing protein [Firmicutes bacterium]|nr:winged helix DNA-binding domain-containing protein [Bacillota bacterium]